MTQFLEVHPENPQRRLIRRAIEILRDGGVIVYPGCSTYALGCAMGDKDAIDRIRAIRQLGNRHNFTLACRDLSEIGTYARVDNSAFRLLKAHTPGPFTFVLRATAEVPRRLQHPRKKTIAIQVPENPIAMMLLKEWGEPMMTSTLLLPDETLPLTEPSDMMDALGGRVDAVLAGVAGGHEPSTVVDFSEGAPVVLRHGAGDAQFFES